MKFLRFWGSDGHLMSLRGSASDDRWLQDQNYKVIK